MNKIAKKILLTLATGIISCLITCTISFFLSRMLLGDPVLAILGEGHFSSELYDAIYHELGLDQPIIIQLFRYINDMLVGDWGYSLSILRSCPAYILIMERIFPTLTLLLIPVLLGLVLGYFFGNYSLKFESRKEIRGIKIVLFAGVIIPIITLTLSFQFFSISATPILELIILWIALMIPIISLTILFVQLNLNVFSGKNSSRRSRVIFIFVFCIGYSIIYLFLIQTEIMFSFEGIGELFLQAISSTDYYVTNAIMFLMLFGFPIFIIFCLFSFFLFKKIKLKYELRPSNDTEVN